MSTEGEGSGAAEELRDLETQLGFLMAEVSDEDLETVNNSQRSVAKFLIMEFRKELRSCVEFLRDENQTTREGVTEGMKTTIADMREWRGVLEENSRLRSQALETRLNQLGNQVQTARTEPGALRRSEGPKPARPDIFSGDRSRGKEWIRTILHYIELRPQEFTSDGTRIGWTLSFFKEGRANGFAQEAYDYKERHDGQWKWTTWDEFLNDFRSEFYEQEAETIAFLKLEATEYFQGKRSASDYCDAFQKLVREAALTDRRTIVSKFRRGLRRDIDEQIAKDIGLILDDPDRWYSKAKDYELIAKFNKAYHNTGPPPTRNFFPYKSPTTQQPSNPPTTPRSTPETPPERSTPDPLPTPTTRPQDARSKLKSRLKCWNCNKEGHPSWLCPDNETERKEQVRVTELVHEDVLALARLGMELVQEEDRMEREEQDF